MTLYNFIKNINSYSIANQSVKEFNSGDVYEIMNSGVHTYPAIVLTINSVSSEGDNSRVRGTLFYIDRLLSDNTNKDFVQSFGISVLNAIMVQSYTNDYLCYENRNYVPFTEKFGDLCAGVYCEFEVLIDGEAVCVDGDFVSKTLTITENGTYNPTGYDSVEVNVHSEDMLNYFTLYPSNYIYANYFDPTTEIVANVKFTGDEDFYFCSDEKGLVGLYYSAKDNETYAYWDSEPIALHFHKSDWEKGFYKIIFKAGKVQIGYLTWDLGETKGTTVSYDPLYFGYKEEKTSPMEIEYISFVHPTVGQLSNFRPKIEDERAKLWDVTYDREVDIRTVYSASDISLIDFAKSGGKFGYSIMSNFDTIKNVAPYIVDGRSMFCYANVLDPNDVELSFPELTDANNMFDRFGFAHHIKRNNAILHCDKLIDANNMFSVSTIGDNTIVYTTNAFKTINNMFYNNYWCYTAEVTDCTGVNSDINCRFNRYMTNIRFNNYGKGFTKKHTVLFTDCPKYTSLGLLDTINSFYNITLNTAAAGSTIQVDASLYNTLTDEDKQKITNKGWTLVAR